VLVALLVVIVALGLSHAFIRQQWLRYLRRQALSDVTTFVAKSQDFDSASSAALALIQEVELVSRGYRMYVPYLPILKWMPANTLQKRATPAH
jgi:hypothetical protein